MIIDEKVKLFWNQEYHENDIQEAFDGSQSSSLQRRQSRNRWMASDFLLHVRYRPAKAIIACLDNANTALEIGCGTGEFLQEIIHQAQLKSGIGIDLSENAITAALKLGSPPETSMKFGVGNFLKIGAKGVDLVIANQVLEHFRDPRAIAQHLQKMGKYVLILTPYKERVGPTRKSVMDGDDDHKVSIDEFTYRGLPVIEDMVFFSKEGWGVSRKGECPLQYAVLIKGAPEESSNVSGGIRSDVNEINKKATKQ